MTQCLHTCGSNLMCCAPCPPPDVTYDNFFDIASDEANLTQQEINIIVDYCHGPFPMSTTETPSTSEVTTQTEPTTITATTVTNYTTTNYSTTLYSTTTTSTATEATTPIFDIVAKTGGPGLGFLLVCVIVFWLFRRYRKKPIGEYGFNNTQEDTRMILQCTGYKHSFLIHGNIGNCQQYTVKYTKTQEKCTSIESNQQNDYFEMETTENTQNVCIIEGENDVNIECSVADIRVDIQDKIQTPGTKLVNMKQFDTDHGVQQDTSYNDGESVKQRKVVCEESFNKSNTKITRF